MTRESPRLAGVLPVVLPTVIYLAFVGAAMSAAGLAMLGVGLLKRPPKPDRT